MGGYGSGRPRKRGCITNMLALDLRELKRLGGLLPDFTYTYTWSLAGLRIATARYTAKEGELLLNYNVGNKDKGERILLTQTDCHFGGERTWFLCPTCGRRCAILYGAPFRCRRCHDLSYPSQSDDQQGRLFRRMRHIREKLGASHVFFTAVSRPKGMHEKAYWRLLDQLRKCEYLYLGVFTARVKKIEKARWK